MNAGMRCSSYGGCRADCIPQYQFPNGKIQVMIICQDGQWRVSDEPTWDGVPSCQPICLPECLNNGICLAPNQCQCPENFSGPQCQYENKPCLNPPQLPKNSKRSCRAKQCTIECLPGHQFPDGSSITTMVCSNGLWLPSKPQWGAVPDCKATCSPQCLNGGSCLSFNVCQCPQDFRGPQCQYSASACSAKQLQFNGGYNCSGDMDSFSCSISCPEGISFQFPPEPKYTCFYSQGQFLPSPQPQCVFPGNFEVISHGSSSHQQFQTGKFGGEERGQYFTSAHRPDEQEVEIFKQKMIHHGFPAKLPETIINEVDQILVVPTMSYGESESNVIDLVPKPGSCFTWGGSHFKTFDGKIFSFESKCPHVLLKDAIDNTFSVIVQNHPSCFNQDPNNCYRVIKVFVRDRQYFLKRTEDGSPVFATSKKILPIPGQLPGLRVTVIGSYIVLSLDALGLVLKWDGKLLLHVEAQASMWNRTEGLCGRMDGDKLDDFITKEGLPAMSVSSLAASWLVDDLEEPCNDSPIEIQSCGPDLTIEAGDFCAKLFSEFKFRPCTQVVDAISLLESCKSDYCSCKSQDKSVCVCDTFEVYVKDCQHKGVKGVTGWRSENLCPMKCEGGQVYMACAPEKGHQMCGAVSVPRENQEECLEGCYCPEGTVLHENKCITKDQCPCRLRGKSFPPGTSIPKECNTCTCSNGEWDCTQVSCGARCAAVGDPHYITFDGKSYDFMGQCSYYLVKTENFTIEAENVACAGAISQAMNFPVSIASGLPSCTKTVTVKMNEQTVKLKQNMDIVVNGRDVTKVPYSISGITIRAVSSIFLLVELMNGVKVWWDGVTRVYIDVPASLHGLTKGLCGTFNGNQKDDFVTPENDVEHSIIPFANKWKTSEKCNDVPDALTTHPCDLNLHNKAAAEKYCSRIKSDLFKPCHWHVDPEKYHQDCLYDMCACEFQVSRCLCPTMAAYAAECSRSGLAIDWRNEVRECGVHCPGGQKYQSCGNSCTRTCDDLSLNPDCKPQCVEGCNCPEGEALDDNGECIPIGQCKCYQEGLDFQAGYKEVRPASHGVELCTCLKGLWSCHLATEEDVRSFPRAHDLKAKCNSSRNFEFTTCEDVEPVTCKNMHTNEHFSPTVCHAGCKCKEGYVLDSKNKKCVKPNECPCHHGGRSYKEKSIVQSDCNTCTCKNGKWQCTERQCTAECSAWGDSHYKTFDGKYFDYQGQCDFMLAKGSSGTDSFDVTIQNVPCGSLGTSCSKSVTLRVSLGGEVESFTLNRDKTIPRLVSKKLITIREKGVFVIMEAPDLGLLVHWDKGTRVYVKVDPRWKEKIKGLCGNYNDNQADDFQTPSGGLAEASASIFGDSWRLQNYCPEALEIKDTCVENPERRVWALKKCGVLKSSIFAPCHSEVPLEDFFDRCVFDACACDQGEDCQCLCTALAAYAQECNNRGAPVKWRSQMRCPMQCDQRCAEYQPCISTCPHETCDNLMVNDKLSKSCSEDACIEGCSPKPCPPDHVYLNESYIECVPRNICKPICMEFEGVVYYEGDLMQEDDCHSCYCSRGEKICKGQPCSSTEVPVFATTVQQEQDVQCLDGWSAWINQDLKEKFKIKLSDIEPLPSAIILNNLKDSSKCGINEMVSIECLTIDGKHPKELDVDVECSLERGLICQSTDPENPCPDFKIRVLCQCQEISTTPIIAPNCDLNIPNQEHPSDCHKFLQCSPSSTGLELVEKTCGSDMFYNPETMICDWEESVIKIKPSCKPKCPPGMVHEECAIECDKLCAYYLFIVREKGLCIEGTKCEAGCISAEKHTKCPKGHLWLNENTCVVKHDCMCISDKDKPVKPGQVVTEDCKECQCVENSFSCSSSQCKEEFQEEKQSKGIPSSTTESYLVPSVSPPPECSGDRFVNLIQGDQPLPDSAFSASSSLSPLFGPNNARIDNNKISDKSGGSWAPQNTNPDQYLEINFGHQEPIYGIIIKGSPLYDEYITSFLVLYSPDDSSNFYYVLNQKIPPRPQIFRGSVDAFSPVKQIFSTPFEATRVRIKPRTWNNAISLRMEILGCSEEEPTTTPFYEFLTTPFKVALCDDQMGLSNGLLVDQQIRVSSEASEEVGKKQIRLNSDSSWQPLTNSMTEWVEFDFLEKRNITAIVTKGGDKGWVTAFSVKYSVNALDWNPLLDEKGENEKVFLGNFDSNSPQVNSFHIAISARYLKILPLKWHNTIQLRVEVQGCFKPYPEVIVLSTTPSPSYPCNNCPGVITETLEIEACRCLDDQWFDGTKCVNRTQCPCMVGHIAYEVGSVFEKEDCSECICKLGGVEHCTAKQCGPCKEGLKSTVTGTCRCVCLPCPADFVLCPRSNICIHSTLWCNGVQDCPDDEVDCATPPPLTTTTTKKPEACPLVECQKGFSKVLEKAVVDKEEFMAVYRSPMLSGAFPIKSKLSSKKSKIAKKQNFLALPLKEVEEELICPEFKCVNDKPPPNYIHIVEECPKVVCQPGFIPVLDNYGDAKTKTCPTYSCYPQPPPDTICNVTGRTFNTFDDTEFKYDICNHVIARDLSEQQWTISLRKNCIGGICSRDMVIVHHGDEIIIRSDLTTKYNGYDYTVDQIKNLGAHNKGFSVSQLGSTLLFVSKRFGFWIIWNKLGNVKLGVAHKLMRKVDGLCGYFNGYPEDDKRRPDGAAARTTADFGNSWALSQDQPEWCEAKACPMHIQNNAWDTCNKVKEQPLNQCAKSLDIEAFVSRCLDATCACLEKAEGNHTAEEECRCGAMQNFVVDCLSADTNIDLSDWRMQHDCPAFCDPPLVYHDCYQRKCEPTCESIADPDICPKVSKMCFPGCYCPAGHVKKANTCIKPSSCRDCECNVLPHLQYITYDNSNFTVNGNCVYVMSRDEPVGEEKEHKWQVLITNHPCKNKPDKMCVGKVTILYQGRKIHILVDYYRNKLKLIVDNERVADFEELENWAKMRETSAKHLKMLLTDVQVEVSVYYPSLGVSVKAPSHKYGGKLEGLCGDCNKNPNDDIRNGPFDGHPGGKPKDINDFALSWLYEHLPGGQTRAECANKLEEKCPEVPPKDDPCTRLLDDKIFGQCLNVMDPSLFVDWCKKDTCGNFPDLSCAAIEAFARDCAAQGFCINWRNEHCPTPTCPSGLSYNPCAKKKQETCDDLKNTAATLNMRVSSVSLIDGCFCPEEKVLLNETCVKPKDCEVCDEEGHHPGDVWKKDKCTTCKCEGTSLKCESQFCAGKETVCERGYNPVKIPSKEESCCDKYACVVEPTDGPTCATPQKLVCAEDQVLKLDTKPNGCQTFICECKARDECDLLDLTTEEPLEPGIEREIDDNGCCPRIKLVCNKENCAKTPAECPQYYTLKKEHVTGKCCPSFVCEPPEDKCIFETGYGAAEAGGENELSRYEKQKLLKPGNDTWQDGPCRECQCILATPGNYQATCSKTDCPSLESHEDHADYILKQILVPNHCCPKVERSACKFQGEIHQIGEKWQQEGDYCKTYSCVKSDKVRLETSIESCNERKCNSGFKYIEPTQECCGKCAQVACVVGDMVRQVDEHWNSSDHCTNYFCLSLNGSLQVEAVKINCPQVTKEDLKNFVYESYPVDGECCHRHEAVACKVGKAIYKIGETWPSPDGDKCRNVTCIRKQQSSELVQQESIESCKKDCPMGWEYIASLENQQCCGECVQAFCIINEDLKQPNETWKSEDGCVTYSCDNLGGQLLVSSHHESCPSLNDCPEENVYTKGCCQYCNVTTGQEMNLCSPQALQPNKTMGLIKVHRAKNGICVNREPIKDFNECVGTCHSSTFFNIKSGLHESVCSCCQATDYRSLKVDLVCEDGYKWVKKVAVPSKCGCRSCEGAATSYVNNPTGAPF
ncbi:hemocytin [Euwallacea similis]|uniref:hemocytin n=1 Tax=Euwallacea similis TaxID=1736056 RepID=UPI00344C7896